MPLSQLSDDELRDLTGLWGRLQVGLVGDPTNPEKRYGFNVLKRYYNGLQQLEQLGLAVPADLRKFVTIVAWPGTAVDAIEERCDLDGFRLPNQPEADKDLWDVWQYNQMDHESQMGHLDSLRFGRAYGCAGTGEDPEMPLLTVESPMQMSHLWSPRERQTRCAARFYQDDSTGDMEYRATFYQRMSTSWLTLRGGQWEVDDRDVHNLGRCPVVPIVNRATLDDRYGVSEMLRLIGLTDAAARDLTKLVVASEVMALPQRWAAGMSQADFTDPDTGEALAAWETYFGAIWATPNAEAKFGQFSAADLKNFTDVIDMWAHLVANTSGLPLRYFSRASVNPPSGDGIRADESRLVKICERRELGWGEGWEQLMRLVRQLQRGGRDDPKLSAMETLWRNPATPTRSQMADATLKLAGPDRPIISLRQARRDLGYSAVEIANMERDDAEVAAADPLARSVEAFRFPPAPGEPAPEAAAAGARSNGAVPPAAASNGAR